MSRPPAPRPGVYIRSGPVRRPSSAPDTPPDSAPAPSRGWPFAEGSQNHLDESSAPWPRPSRLLSAKPSDSNTPDQ
jgi:hypothetical protein